MVIIPVSFLSHGFFFVFEYIGVLHEHPRIGSDGESEEVSLASDPDVTSPVKMRQKNRRLSEVRRGKCSFSTLFGTKTAAGSLKFPGKC